MCGTVRYNTVLNVVTWPYSIIARVFPLVCSEIDRAGWFLSLSLRHRHRWKLTKLIKEISSLLTAKFLCQLGTMSSKSIGEATPSLSAVPASTPSSRPRGRPPGSTKKTKNRISSLLSTRSSGKRKAESPQNSEKTKKLKPTGINE